MTDDALWIIDLFKMQIGSLRNELEDKRIRPERFDRLSYSVWAVQEVIACVRQYSGYVTVGIIREILHMMKNDYDRYYRSNNERHIRYKHALEMIEELLDLTGGYSNDY